jgi:hypothetical protein
MAAEEQLRELGEKLQAAAPTPADALAKLLEVRPCGRTREYPFFRSLFSPLSGGTRPARGSAEDGPSFAWICARGAAIRQV